MIIKVVIIFSSDIIKNFIGFYSIIYPVFFVKRNTHCISSECPKENKNMKLYFITYDSSFHNKIITYIFSIIVYVFFVKKNTHCISSECLSVNSYLIFSQPSFFVIRYTPSTNSIIPTIIVCLHF